MSESVNIGDVIAVLKARDEMSAVFKSASRESERAMEVVASALENAQVSQESFMGAIRQFGGIAAIEKANSYAAAIKQIGGANALTAKEQQQVNAVVSEAIAKYEVLGSEAPPALYALAAQTSQVVATVEPLPAKLDKVSKAGSFLKSTFGQMFSALSATAIVGRVTSFLADMTSQAFETAGALVDMSNKTGLSTETIQRMGYVAKQNGADVSQFTDAAFNMGVRVAQGGGKARQAADDLKISWQALKTASPDQQFNMVVEALERMENPQKRNEAAVALFGKTAKPILAAIADGYSKVAKEATITGDAQVKALDAAGDAYDKFKDRVHNFYRQWMGNIFLAREQTAKLTAEQQSAYAAIVKSGGDGQAYLLKLAELARKAQDVNLPVQQKALPANFVADLKEAEKGFRDLSAAKRADLFAALALGKSNDDIIDQLNITDEVLQVAKKAYDDQKSAINKANDEAKKHRDLLKEIAAATVPLTDLEKTRVKLLTEQGISQSKIAQSLNVSEVAVERYTEALEAEKDILEQVRAAAQKVSDLQFKPFGRNVTSAVPMIDVEAVRKNTKTVQQIIDAGMADFESRMAQAGIYTRDQLANMASAAQEKFAIMVASGKYSSEELKKALKTLGLSVASDVGKAVGDLAQSFATMAQIAGGSIGAIVDKIGTLVGSLNTANKGLDSFKEGKAAFKSGDTMAGITGMASGIMGIASAAIAAGKAIKNMFFGTAGRDLVKEFADTFRVFDLDTMQFSDGFQELRKQLNSLGPEGDRLWKALTQGVGRNNPEQARAVIELITKALQKQKEAIDDTSKAATTAADEQVAATSAAMDAIRAMDDQIKSLTESIAGEAPEEFMGEVERITREQIDSIEKQKKAAQAAIDDTTKAAAEAAEEAGDIIDEALEKREFRIRVKVDLDGLPEGARAPSGYTGERTPTSGSSFRNPGASLPPIYITSVSQLDGREVARNQVRYLPNELLGAGR